MLSYSCLVAVLIGTSIANPIVTPQRRPSSPVPRSNARCNDKIVKERLNNLEPSYNADEDPDTPLHVAARRGDLALTNCLLTLGSSINARGRYGKTPLHAASTAGAYDIARVLLERGAEVDVIDDMGGDSPLHCCANAGHTRLISLLLDEGADPNKLNRRRNGPLHRAAASGQVEAVKLLIENGADVNLRGYLGRPPLHDAATVGSVEIAELLLNHSAQVDAKDDYTKSTALHVAATFGHDNVSDVLLRFRANINAGDVEDDTPLHKTCEYGFPNVTRFLIRRGVGTIKIDQKGRFGRTPLIAAAAFGQAEIAELLLNNSADIMAVDEDQATALILAARYGKGPIVKLLLRRDRSGLLRLAKNKWNKTAAQEAAANSQSGIARYINQYPNGNERDLQPVSAKVAEIDFDALFATPAPYE